MTLIEQEIEKLAEKHVLNPSYLTEVAMLRAAMAELIPLIREECAKIAIEDSQGCLEMAKLCTPDNDPSDEDRIQHTMDSHIGIRIAAAIREGK
jgi:hypothetical protein